MKIKLPNRKQRKLHFIQTKNSYRNGKVVTIVISKELLADFDGNMKEVLLQEVSWNVMKRYPKHTIGGN